MGAPKALRALGWVLMCRELDFEIWNLKILKSGIWKFWNLKSANFEIWNFEIWNLKISTKKSKIFDPTFFWRRIFPIGQKINDRLAMELRSFLEPFPVRATEGEVFLKYTKIWPKSRSGAILPESDFENVSGQQNSVLTDAKSEQRNFSCQILSNYVGGHSGASGGIWGARPASRFRQSAPTWFWKIRELAKISVSSDSRKPRYPRSVFGTRL